MRHTSMFRNIQVMIQEAVDQTALHSLEVLSEWVREQGYPELADRMVKEFTEEAPEEPDAYQPELEL